MPVVATVLFLAGCTTQPPMNEFAGAIKNAKQAGRALVIFRIYSTQRYTGKVSYDVSHGVGGVRVGVDFITTGTTTLRSVSVYILPYNNEGNPLRARIKRFTAKGPFHPNQVYRLLAPDFIWADIFGGWCVTPIEMTIKKADGTVIHVDKKNIGKYMVPRIRTDCRAHPGSVYLVPQPVLFPIPSPVPY
jgi:hypothetical protein